MLYCFLDTNIFIEFKDIAEIDWLSELSCSNVCLVVTSIVVRELDAMKTDYKSKRRRNRAIAARNFLAQIDVKSENPITRGVSLRYAHKRPTSLTMKKYELSIQINDDVLLASALQFAGEHPTDSVVLVTDDLDLRFRARVNDLSEQSLSDESRLKEQSDPRDREIKRLKDAIRTYENAQPILTIGFQADEGEIEKFFRINVDFQENLITDGEIQKRIENERERLQFSPKELRRDSVPGDAHRFMQPGMVTDSDVSDYNDRLDTYLEYLRVYLEEDFRFRVFHNQAIRLWLAVVNSGAVPANHVEICLRLRECREVLTHEPDEPDFVPSPPARPEPRTLLERLNVFRGDLFLPQTDFDYEPVNFGRRSEEWVVTTQRDGAILSEFYVERLMHHRSKHLDEIFLIVDKPSSASTALDIEYEIIAENLIKKLTGKLKIIINKRERWHPSPTPASST